MDESPHITHPIPVWMSRNRSRLRRRSFRCGGSIGSRRGWLSPPRRASRTMSSRIRSAAPAPFWHSRGWIPASVGCHARAGTATHRHGGTAERAIRHPTRVVPRLCRVCGIWSAQARTASTTNLPDGRKALRGGTIQYLIAPTAAVGEGSAIVAPVRATATSSRNSSANNRTSSGRSGWMRKVQRPERGCPTIGPNGTLLFCMCAFTACPRRMGIVIAHTDPARMTIRPSSGGSTTAGRSHSRR